jgi:hypothetical protein
MMTVEEKMAMWAEKKRFVDGINAVFQTRPAGSSVSEIKYEVYQTNFQGETKYAEWLTVCYDGGAFSPAIVTGNSNIANYEVIGDSLLHGNYELVKTYESLASRGWEQIELS